MGDRKVAFIAGATGAAATRLVEELVRQNWEVPEQLGTRLGTSTTKSTTCALT